jgi:hypothetical protein
MLERIDNVWTRGSYTVFRNMGPKPIGKTKWAKTNVYEVTAALNAYPLGRIAWYTRWRKYVFEPSSNCIFEETCLRDISQFIEEETAAQRAKAKAAKATK